MSASASSDPIEPRALIEGAHSDRTINDSLLDHVWKAPSKGWWACFAAALAMLGCLVIALGYTLYRGVGAWGEILGDTTVAAAMLDRLLHRSVVINLDGESYRLRDHHAAAETLRRTTTGTRQQLH